MKARMILQILTFKHLIAKTFFLLFLQANEPFTVEVPILEQILSDQERPDKMKKYKYFAQRKVFVCLFLVVQQIHRLICLN